jgi:uncharacterized repeat protein (TIGR03803 family)
MASAGSPSGCRPAERSDGATPVHAVTVCIALLAVAFGVGAGQPVGAISILKAFQPGPNEGQPFAPLICDAAGNFYGTTRNGGTTDVGTVFTLNANGTGYTVLHTFAGGAADGANPSAGLVLDGSGNLYGTTVNGGASGYGTVFKVRTDGAGFAVLHSFAGGAADGWSPSGGLVFDGSGNLVGITERGGTSDLGTVFTIKTDGAGFAVLHSFAGGVADGLSPVGPVIFDGSGAIFGTTYDGGTSNAGTVFTLRTDGTGFTLLHSFQPDSAADGLNPEASLILDGSGNLYGTTHQGGASGSGTVFTITTGGSGFTILHSFMGWETDGTFPEFALVLDGEGNLYGTCSTDSPWQYGAVFTVKTDGTGFAILHTFAHGTADGAIPTASLTLDDSGNVYGSTSAGGAWDGGTVFRLGTDGTGFVVLHSFAGGTPDGSTPLGSLILDPLDNLYGTAAGGGIWGDGTVFTVKTDGTGFAVLHTFDPIVGEGGGPRGSLILGESGHLFGTTSFGSPWNFGTVFTVKTDGTNFAVLDALASAADGQNPVGSLIADASGTLYGTSEYGGMYGGGTIFALRVDGKGFTVLHSFAGGSVDGIYPAAGLILDGSGNLYGTTDGGGSSGHGTVFTIKTGGTGFTVLHSFGGEATDALNPQAPLILDCSSNLYGTTYYGGTSDRGTVFTLKSDGTGFSVLHSFVEGGAGGTFPRAPLILDGAGNLYGTTSSGGGPGYGTVFTIKTDGTGFSVLHTFAGEPTDGARPYGSVVLDGSGILYGTTQYGGPADRGVVFSLPIDGDFPPQQLTISKDGSGTGAVTSDPGAITCGSICSWWFVDSTAVTLSAAPATGSSFTGWSGEGCSGTGTCGVTIDQSRSVTATFTSCTVILSDETVSTTETFTSCGTLTAGSSFRIEAPGDVTVRAAVRVILTNGFSVGSGGVFHAGLDPSLTP